MTNEIGISLGEVSVPHLDQYFGLWAMHGETFESMFARVAGMNLTAHILDNQAKSAVSNGDDEAKMQMLEGGIALISIVGAMTKYGSSFSEGGATVRVRRAVRTAAADPNVKAIVLGIDSPGGMVAGNRDLADDVAAAAGAKPVYAFIEDLGASAAYWVASQTRKIYANPMALVGSIGTYGVVYDMSAAAAQQGIKALLFSSGEYKGMGAPGTEINDKQKAEYQRTVDAMNAHFLEAVSKGRKMPMEKVKALADGRIHLAAEAQGMGLIDAVMSFDAMLSEIRNATGQSAAVKNTSTRRGVVMNEAQIAAAETVEVKPVAATYQEIVGKCKGADEKFICKALAGSMTVEQAADAWMEEQNSRISAANEAAAQVQTKRPGVKDLEGTGKGGSTESAADPITAWNEAVAAKVQSGMDKSRAISAVARENPELRQSYVEAYNAKR
jgi:signal peptide peptidase SppA